MHYKETYNNFDLVIAKLNLPNKIQNYANHLLKELSVECPKYKLRFPDTDVFEHVIVYISCRINNYPCVINDFTTSVIDAVPKKCFHRYYKIIVNILGLKQKITILDPIDIAPKIITELKLNEKEYSEVMIGIEKVKNHKGYITKNPMVIVASTIYAVVMMNKRIMQHPKITQQEIQNVTNITEVSIRNNYRSILKIMREKNDRKNNERINC